MRNISLNKTCALATLTLMAMIASMLFSESPFAYLATAVFLFVLSMLMLDSALVIPRGYPKIVLFVYFTVFVYIFIFSAFLFLFGSGFTPRNFLSSLYVPSLVVLCILLFRKNPKVIEFFFFCFVVFLFYASFQVLNARAVSFDLHGRAIQTNWANFVGSSLAFAFLFKRRMLTFAFLLFGTLIVAIGLKRSGMIIVTFYWLIYFFSFGSVRQFLYNNLIGLFLLGLSGVIAYYFFGSLSLVSIWEIAWARIQNIAEDGGSGRDRILLSGWFFWLSSSEFAVLLGQGHAAFQKYVGLASSLHNDFAELVISYGLIGFVFICTLYYRLAYLTCFLYSRSKQDVPFALATTLSFFVYSNTAGVYFYPVFFCPLIVAYGYLEAVASWRKSLNHSL